MRLESLLNPYSTSYSATIKVIEKTPEQKEKEEKAEKKKTLEQVKQITKTFDQVPIVDKDGEVETVKVKAVRIEDEHATPQDLKDQTSGKVEKQKPQQEDVKVIKSRVLTKKDMQATKNKRIARKIINNNRDMVAAGVKFSTLIL